MSNSETKMIVFIVFLMFQIASSLNHDLPQILTKTTNQTFNLSSTAILTCHIRYLGDHHVTWFKYDSKTLTPSPLAVGENLFTTDKRFSISSYSTSSIDSYWSLEIYHVNLSDEGTYLCQISHRRASLSTSIYLHIQIPMILLPSYLYVSSGANVKLNCSILMTNQTWTKNLIEWHFFSKQFNQTKPEQILIEEQFFNNSLISYLIIEHAQSYHSGLWSCKYQRQRRTAKLIVEKDMHEYQRISALLANRTHRLYSSFICLFFVNIIVVFLYQ